MTIVACLLAVALVAVVHLLLRSHRHTQSEWAEERRELLNRIQRPEIIPTAPVVGYELPEPELDFSDLVGQVADQPEV